MVEWWYKAYPDIWQAPVQNQTLNPDEPVQLSDNYFSISDIGHGHIPTPPIPTPTPLSPG